MAGLFDTVYVYYPRGSRTGGPEALHQLAASLRAAGQNAVMVPRPETRHLTRVASYDHYGVPEAAAIEDTSRNAIVASETALHLLAGHRRASRFCWWLSVDNAPIFYAMKRLQDVWDDDGRLVRAPAKMRVAAAEAVLKNWVRGRYRLLHEVEHLSQSYYAQAFLASVFSLSSTMITDYTRQHVADEVHLSRDPSVVSFNPTKAAAATEAVARRMPDLTFLPLQNMREPEIAAALRRSAIYLDLGYHPGKDRLPREAAVHGAVSVVARRGSGAFDEDVPIPWEHKVPVQNDAADSAASVLRAVLADLDGAQRAQQPYRDWIGDERARFDSEVADAFVAGRFRSRGA